MMPSQRNAALKAETEPSRKRWVGRPPANAVTRIDRPTIVGVALEMSKTVPLKDLSLVMVAKEMEVTPALLHYYLGGRDALTSNIMNAFYKLMLEEWPQAPGRSDAQLIAVLKHMYTHYVLYSGVTEYSMLNNRFRIFQLVREGEVDYGVEVLERFTQTVLDAGPAQEKTGIYAHMLMDFIIGSAHHTVTHHYPSEHRDFLLARTDGLNPARYPALTMTRDSLLKLDAQAAFEEGARLFMTALRRKARPKPAAEPIGNDKFGGDESKRAPRRQRSIDIPIN